jgi:predicted dehydrogenase
MNKLRFALLGTGFWARYQLGGWMQTGLVECVALYNRTRPKAEALAAEFGVPAVYDDAAALLEQERLDFVDICTSVETHAPFTRMAAERGLPVVCQKPMATTLHEAREMAAFCAARGVPLYINENWRWQHPIRVLKAKLDSGRIGRVFRARLDYSNSFPVFDNQPFLRELEQFILTDMGTHILDVARFLFGEASMLYAHTDRVHADIRGEDVATVMMRMGGGASVVCNLSYASPREHDRFPEVYIQIEGERGSLELAPDYWIRETVIDRQDSPDSGLVTRSTRHKPPRFAWADPTYDLAHAAIYPAQRNLARALLGQEAAETTARDNLNTLELVFASYDSARTGQAIAIPMP